MKIEPLKISNRATSLYKEGGEGYPHMSHTIRDVHSGVNFINIFGTKARNQKTFLASKPICFYLNFANIFNTKSEMLCGNDFQHLFMAKAFGKRSSKYGDSCANVVKQNNVVCSIYFMTAPLSKLGG